MDLEALREIIIQLSAEEGFEPGRRYETKITAEEVRRIFGELPPSGAVVFAKVKIMHGPDFQRLSLVRQLRCLPGGKDKPHEK
jgi:hypothetical protein